MVGERVGAFMTGIGRAAALCVAALACLDLAGCEGQSENLRENGSQAGSMAAGGNGGAVAGSTSGGVGAGGPGGAAGSGLGGNGAGGNGGAGGGAAGGAGLPPPPAPLGVFGEVVDRLIVARARAIQAMCCSALCCDDPENLVAPIACLGEEYPIFVPPAGWLACASRLGATDPLVSDFLSMQAGCFEQCAGPFWELECGSTGNDPCICGSESAPAALAGCQASHSFTECLSGPFVDGSIVIGRICNGSEDCADGFDERNCDPAVRSFRCASGENVPWLSLCDGTAACSDASDEFACSSADI
jgi:hypothetical protein